MLGKLGEREFFEKMLNELHTDLKIRGEKLTLEQFREIADYIYQNGNISSSSIR